MNQYAYFVLGSTSATAVEMAAHLGLEPDQVRVRGSIEAEPARPGVHAWEIRNMEPGLDVESLIRPLLDRLAPVAPRVRELVDSDVAWASLKIVRYFNDENGIDEEFETRHVGGHAMEKLPGQHQMLGWALEPETIELLSSLRAWVDVDEYGWPFSSE